jgi:hypothetical protein
MSRTCATRSKSKLWQSPAELWGFVCHLLLYKVATSSMLSHGTVEQVLECQTFWKSNRHLHALQETPYPKASSAHGGRDGAGTTALVCALSTSGHMRFERCHGEMYRFLGAPHVEVKQAPASLARTPVLVNSIVSMCSAEWSPCQPNALSTSKVHLKECSARST